MAGGLPLWRIFTMDLVGADKFGRWSSDAIENVGAYIEGLFSAVQQHPACPYNKARWFAANPGFNIDPGEVLVYFVTKRNSLAAANGAPFLGLGGTTWLTSKGMISEVYVDVWLSNVDYLSQAANLVFHEVLHNKVDASGRTDIVHRDGTGLATGGLISGSTPLTLSNRFMMASNMRRAIPQYLAGVPRAMLQVSGMIVSYDYGPGTPVITAPTP